MNLKERLQKHDFKFKKKYGQNFISDGNLLQKIVAAGEVTEQDVVIEVGPGAATLTRALAEKAKAVIAIEIDGDLLPIIEENMADVDNFYLVHGDALQINLDELVK
ncbi:MAG: 16S rRNA (adenine(1518)-N(6)/adenine(1519)-N(6))-dimethyltransferase, partial [Peptococcaceae bacterium]|nr:16S rRNA (adenine(1518)-N(6)/adenine(1519)-N(6))-dimethyltransferase [Peptococcaceae bacterium]